MVCGDVEIQPGPQSVSRVEFQEFTSRKGMKIVHQNIRGLESNFDMLQKFFESQDKIDILTLSETHLTNNSYERCSKLQGYHFVYRNRECGKGGGVAMFFEENITYRRKVDLEGSLAECLWIEIYVKRSKSFLIGCFYRPLGHRNI